MRSESSRDDLLTRLLDIAHAREGNAEAIRRISQQLLEIRAAIRHDLETLWSDGRDSTAEVQERVQHLGERILQDLNAQEELGSQFEAGLAITARLRSVVMDMHNLGLDVSDVLTRIDQIVGHEA